MSKSNDQDELDLLLSLEDRVLETPPASPSGYLSDDGRLKHTGPVDLSAFRDVVKGSLVYDANDAGRARNNEKSKNSGSKEIEVEKFSGLRIQNPVVSRVELSNHLSDIKYVQLPTIKNLIKGDTLSGCWTTIGVLVEKGAPRTSSIGKTFAIWKMGCLGDETVSLFLFGDAYEKTCEAKIGTIFAVFNCSVRKDKPGSFSLSIFSAKHILKLGTSADMGICQGRDGPCTTAIDKRRRKHCNYHSQNSSKKYTSTRTELKGGNLRTGFRDYLKSEGIYSVKPTEDRTNSTKSNKPVKLLSVEQLRKALSKADKVTTNIHSQGLRFLNHMTVKMEPKVTNKAAGLPRQQTSRADNNSVRKGQEPDAKRLKTDPKKAKAQENKTKEVGIKMIELDIISSDEEH